jgi:hypothetical protein
VLGGYRHHRIHHHENQFARGKNHVNGIESFWSFTKLRLAKLRGIRREYLFIHLKDLNGAGIIVPLISTVSCSQACARNHSKVAKTIQLYLQESA